MYFPNGIRIEVIVVRTSFAFEPASGIVTVIQGLKDAILHGIADELQKARDQGEKDTATVYRSYEPGWPDSSAAASLNYRLIPSAGNERDY